jgi:hypothetical protein
MTIIEHNLYIIRCSLQQTVLTRLLATKTDPRLAQHYNPGQILSCAKYKWLPTTGWAKQLL